MTSVGSTPGRSMETATTPSVSPNSSMFPEIDYDTVDASRGMDITIVTTAQKQ